MRGAGLGQAGSVAAPRRAGAPNHACLLLAPSVCAAFRGMVEETAKHTTHDRQRGKPARTKSAALLAETLAGRGTPLPGADGDAAGE